MSEFYHDNDEFYYPDAEEDAEVDGEASAIRAEKNYEEADKENTDTSSEYRDFIEEQQARSTKNKTKSDLYIWERFCKEKNESRKLEAIPCDELNLLLCAFFKDIRKKNGDEYEPGTLTCLQRSIQRHLRIQGDEFKLSREVLCAKRKQLVVERGKGNRPRASREVSDVEEDKLFAEGEFGEHNPVALQRTVWWFLALHFGFRARDESRRLQWGDVSLENDPDTGNEMLVWQAERGSKTRQGQDKPSGHRAFYPTAQATDNQRCPVKYYKLFRSHRPIEMNQPEAPFYLAVKHKRKATDEVWYKKSPLGKNEIGKLLTKAAQNAGLPGRVTNHSVRKTCISRLLDSDVPENYVAQLSGHRNLKSLDSYKSASIQHQRRMSLSLSRSTTTSEFQAAGNAKTTTQVESSSVTATKEAQSAVFQGTNFQNCSFNIQIGMNQQPSQPPLRKRRAILSDDEDD